MVLADAETKIEDDARKRDEILRRPKTSRRDNFKGSRGSFRKYRKNGCNRRKKKGKYFKRREIVADLDLGKIELSMKRSLIEEY